MMNAPLPLNYVLIDLENVKPDNLAKLVGLPFKVYVFLGENQVKLPFEFVESMQKLGENARYIKMSGNGPNALDFHIAYYLGELSVSDPDAYFHIISKDTGFDPLICHLRERTKRRLRVARVDCIDKIPLFRNSEISSISKQLTVVLENFRKRGDSLPRKMDSLESTVQTLFHQKLTSPEVKQIIDALQKLNYMSVNDGRLQYRVPAHPQNGHAKTLSTPGNQE